MVICAKSDDDEQTKHSAWNNLIIGMAKTIELSQKKRPSLQMTFSLKTFRITAYRSHLSGFNNLMLLSGSPPGPKDIITILISLSMITLRMAGRV